MKIDLLCVGLTTLDIVGWPITEIPRNEKMQVVKQIACAPAGTAAGTACIAARLGLDVALAGAVGDDLAGKFVHFALAEAGVRTHHLQTLKGFPTSTTILPIDEQGRRPAFHAPGAGSIPALSKDLLKGALEARCLHYAAIGIRTFDGGPGASLLEQAKTGGAEIVCDLIAPNRHTKNELDLILPFVDWFLPSADEARFLTGLESLESAADAFVGMGAKNCVIKDGGRGAVISAGKLRGRQHAYSVDVVDTTSCGDSFCAGFITAHLKGWEDAEALRFAAATAAMVAQGAATYGKLESFEATRAVMNTMPVLEGTQL